MDSWSFGYLKHGSAAYESARIGAVWNGRVPNRYPRIITYPESTADVQTIIRYAKENKLSVEAKSGGHSWTAHFLRDDSILIDMVKMNNFSYDVAAKTATAQPATYGSDLNADLVQHKLMFPGGHCPTVGLGGFLLQGGFGWNSRKWGMGCENVLAVELVNAEGEVIKASAKENPDWYWAARGSGYGFFGIITSFTLNLWPLPQTIMTSRYVFGLPDFDEVVTAVDKISDQYPLDLEVSIFVVRDQDGLEGTTAAITADALSESRDEALHALNLIHNLPVVKKALVSNTFQTCTMKELLKRFDDLLDNRGRRYAANNLWTDHPAQDLLPSLKDIVDNMPAAPSHLYLFWWVPRGNRQDMAFSMEGRVYVALYGISTDPVNDNPHTDYVVGSLKGMEKFRKGIQLADENLPLHPGKFMKTQNYKKLESLRKKYDSGGTFHSYLRVPPEFENMSSL